MLVSTVPRWPEWAKDDGRHEVTEYGVDEVHMPLTDGRLAIYHAASDQLFVSAAQGKFIAHWGSPISKGRRRLFDE